MMSRVFLDHPRSVDESFVEHAAFASKSSGKLFLAASAAAVHAVVPCLFEKTASTIVAELYAKNHNRGH